MDENLPSSIFCLFRRTSRGSRRHKECRGADVEILPTRPSVLRACLFESFSFQLLITSIVSAGLGKTIISYVSLQLFFVTRTHIIDSSSIIKDIQDMCPTGLDTLSIFHFDFRDKKKQDARNLLSSVLIQLCQHSNQFSKILSSVYSDHGDGSREPEINTLLGSLKTMLSVQGQGTSYIVVDALDESPNSSGPPPRREQVLTILKELIELDLPHTRFCRY
jgi:hypothetical protein